MKRIALIKNEAEALVRTMAGKRHPNYAMKHLFVDGKDLITTDGRRLMIIHDKYSTPDDIENGAYEIKSIIKSKNVWELILDERDIPTPDYKSIVPERIPHDFIRVVTVSNDKQEKPRDLTKIIIACATRDKINANYTPVAVDYGLLQDIPEGEYNLYAYSHDKPIMLVNESVTYVCMPFNNK